ncbi:PQQ-binding-like beta-propeller repeat protein [Nocardia tengchongensis]|uniref:PQQ-binding-like beta-propeller repeat protein n=1 Tax=Nocardia tengchongensis TaxID=2055889 RepID=A0ABX8CMX0_9NOCA|nr:PQQ-binding-like beta-propeller repeat protein [Nocardia tengchongensis]
MKTSLSPDKNAGWQATSPVSDGDSVIAAFTGSVNGTGTSKDKRSIEIIAADKSTGKLQWSAVIDTGESPLQDLRIVGITGDSLVLSSGEPTFCDWSDRTSTTWVVDASTKKLRWKREGLMAGQVGKGVVSGNVKVARNNVAETALGGLDLTDGHTLWESPTGGSVTNFLRPDISDLAVTATCSGKNLDLIDPTSGAVLFTENSATHTELNPGWSCVFDQSTMLICQEKVSQGRIVGIDVSSPKRSVWQLSSNGDRMPPKITGAYHGIVYALVDRGKMQAVALDANSGQDLPDSPVVAPVLVDNYLGVTTEGIFLPVR